jgi:hypothetical protein
MTTLERELLDQFQMLNPEQQQQVLDYVRQFAQPVGELGSDFLARTSQIHFPKEDLEEMARYIEEEFEKIDYEEWNIPPLFPD